MAVCPRARVLPSGRSQIARKMVLELAGDAAFDGPMSRIVDSRRHLIGDQASFDHEEFDGKHSDVGERVHDPLQIQSGRERSRFGIQ